MTQSYVRVVIYTTAKGTISVSAHWHEFTDPYSSLLREKAWACIDRENLAEAVDNAWEHVTEALLAHAETQGIELYEKVK